MFGNSFFKCRSCFCCASVRSSGTSFNVVLAKPKVNLSLNDTIHFLFLFPSLYLVINPMCAVCLLQPPIITKFPICGKNPRRRFSFAIDVSLPAISLFFAFASLSSDFRALFSSVSSSIRLIRSRSTSFICCLKGIVVSGDEIFVFLKTMLEIDVQDQKKTVLTNPSQRRSNFNHPSNICDYRGQYSCHTK